jgi:hypothetical protein
VPPLVYLFWVNHYAVNAFQGDDWNMLSEVVPAIHGHLNIQALWGQYQDSRIPLIKMVFDVFAWADGLDTRAICLFNAVIYIGTYCLLLALVRRYLGRQLAPLPVLLVGLVWFSLADLQNPLWAFMLGWYLVALFLLATLCCLLLPKTLHTRWLAAALCCAVLCSLSYGQGLLVWPLGLACILWSAGWPVSGQIWRNAIIWCASAFLFLVIFVIHWNPGDTGCVHHFGCTPGYAPRHPVAVAGYFILILGNVVPGGYFVPVGNVTRWEIVGLLLLVVSIWVLAQSFRSRKNEPCPIAALLVIFGLLFDLLISFGRASPPGTQAIQGNRYVFASLMVLTGIVIYITAHWRRNMSLTTSYGVLIAFMAWQTPVATQFGFNRAAVDAQYVTAVARVATNIDRLPGSEVSCLRVGFILPRNSLLLDARSAQLGEFSPGGYASYRHQGPPSVTACSTSRKDA